ncbi:unnamed protein product [Lasius platythorax]
MPPQALKKTCCFRLKEKVDSMFEVNLLILWLPNVNLEWLRMKLWKDYGVPKNRRIFYIDNDGDNVPIDSECELDEALKLAHIAFIIDDAIPLIVGDSPKMSYVEKYLRMDEARLLKKEQSRNMKSTMVDSFNHCAPVQKPTQQTFLQHLSLPTRRRDLEQKSIIRNVWPSKIFDAERDEPKETKIRRTDEQIESKVDTQRELNASLQHCSNCTLPPLWFTEYMESMKKDMTSTITNEVVKNVTEALNNRLDSLALSPLKELGQSGSQYSSLATRHPECSSDSNEKNQKKIRSQDQEQLSDVSIERADEPRNANITKDMQIKKDVISTITNEVVKEVTELLNKIPPDPVIPVPSKDQSQSQSHLPSSTPLSRYSFDSHSSEKSQEMIRPQDWEQLSDNASIVRVDESSWYSSILENSTRQLQKRLDLIEDVIRANVEEEKKKRQNRSKPSLDQRFTDLNRKRDIEKEKEQSVQNNAWEDLILRKNLPQKNLNEEIHLEALKLIENELRMSCSVTGHQMLDEGRLSKDILGNQSDNEILDFEKYMDGILESDNMTSFWSCDQEEKGEKEKEEDDDAFEIIQMPTSTDEIFIEPFVEPATEQRHHDSNRDSPSFELLSEPPSPPCSIHLNEDHFSANEEKLEQQSMKTNSPNSVYVVDIHGKIFDDALQSVNSDERVSVDSEKQPDITYSYVVEEDFPSTAEAHSSKSSCMEHRSNERKSPRDDANGSYDDVRNSHASYLTVQIHCDSRTPSQCSCQSQTDSGDFTQSFHSHTTSVIDTTDMYAHPFASKYGEHTTANDVREATTATAAPRNNHDVRTKETRTNEKYCHDKCPNNDPEYSCASNNSYPCSRDPSFGASSQSYEAASRASRSTDRSCSNVGSRKTPTDEQALLSTADSVHILPETLVSAAAQVGSFAFDTAREMFDKLRAHTKEDPLKRRGGVKCENKKFSDLAFY